MLSPTTRRTRLTVCGLLLAGLAAGACHLRPDIRRLCEKKCSCGCDIEACVVDETARLDSMRISEKCSQLVDDLTNCQIENGHCEVNASGKIVFFADACGEMLPTEVICQRSDAKR